MQYNKLVNVGRVTPECEKKKSSATKNKMQCNKRQDVGQVTHECEKKKRTTGGNHIKKLNKKN